MTDNLVHSCRYLQGDVLSERLRVSQPGNNRAQHTWTYQESAKHKTIISHPSILAKLALEYYDPAKVSPTGRKPSSVGYTWPVRK